MQGQQLPSYDGCSGSPDEGPTLNRWANPGSQHMDNPSHDDTFPHQVQPTPENNMYLTQDDVNFLENIKGMSPDAVDALMRAEYGDLWDQTGQAIGQSSNNHDSSVGGFLANATLDGTYFSFDNQNFNVNDATFNNGDEDLNLDDRMLNFDAADFNFDDASSNVGGEGFGPGDPVIPRRAFDRVAIPHSGVLQDTWVGSGSSDAPPAGHMKPDSARQQLIQFAGSPHTQREAVSSYFRNSQPTPDTAIPPAYVSTISQPQYQAGTHRWTGYGARNFLDVPEWNYTIPSGGRPINCTLVEIIVFLPLWFRNRFFARRFLNNGIANSDHLMILLEHRNVSLSVATKNLEEAIQKGYKKTMRGPGAENAQIAMNQWEKDRQIALNNGQVFTRPQPQVSATYNWTRLTHKSPDDWDVSNMAVNGYQPDCVLFGRHGRASTRGIPFRDLARGVAKYSKVSTGDSADLTRAIEYARDNRRIDPESGVAKEYLFPDHWQEILDRSGRTIITPDHYDPACIARYRDIYSTWKSAKVRKAPGADVDDSAAGSTGGN